MPHITASDQTISRLLGAEHEASISLILDHSPPGHGPRLHRHPTTKPGSSTKATSPFQLDDQQLNARPGDVVIAPAGAAQKFTNNAPGHCDIVCIHASPTVSTEWLE